MGRTKQQARRSSDLEKKKLAGATPDEPKERKKPRKRPGTAAVQQIRRVQKNSNGSGWGGSKKERRFKTFTKVLIRSMIRDSLSKLGHDDMRVSQEAYAAVEEALREYGTELMGRSVCNQVFRRSQTLCAKDMYYAKMVWEESHRFKGAHACAQMLGTPIPKMKGEPATEMKCEPAAE